MAKKTILELVKSIMSDMDSDEITSIDDTVEATQVANTIRDVYEQLITNERIPEQQQLRNALDNATNKVFVPIDTDIQRIKSIRVADADGNFSKPKYLCQEDFLDMVLKYSSDDDNVEDADTPDATATIRVKNDEEPKYWTSFDDGYIAFNSYDTTHNSSGIQSADVLFMVSYYPVFTLSDSFILPIDENLFPYILAEAKATCFANLKQQSNQKIESQARRQKVKLQHGRYRTDEAEKASLSTAQPNFGRGSTR